MLFRTPVPVLVIVYTNIQNIFGCTNFCTTFFSGDRDLIRYGARSNFVSHHSPVKYQCRSSSQQIMKCCFAHFLCSYGAQQQDPYCTARAKQNVSPDQRRKFCGQKETPVIQRGF
jgi:hypothetical protein